MNDVGGSESGTGLRPTAGKPSRTADTNFEYDDSEWDVGIGNLIIDLDADIEKNNEANRTTTSANNTVANNSASNSNSPNHSPNNSSVASSSTTSSQMHIPHSSTTSSSTSSNNSSSNNSSTGGKGKPGNSTFPSGSKAASVATGNSGDISGASMEHSAVVDKGLKMKIKRTKTGTKSGADAKHEIVKSDLGTSSTGASSINSTVTGASKNSSGSVSDSISSKSAHSSSSHKDKDKVKDSNLSMIDADRDVGGSISNHSSSGASANNGIKDGGNNDQGKGKTPRKGNTHKKVKSSNGSGNSKKDERNNTSNSSDSKSNAISIGQTHTKDGKEFFTATVSLNVPTIVPNTGSTFSKTTLKVPSTNASSLASNSQSNMQIHSAIDASSSVIRNHHSLPNASPWTAGSPSKAVEKGSNSTVPSLGTLADKDQGSSSPSSGKKSKPAAAVDKDKGTVSLDDGISVITGNMPTAVAAFRNTSPSSDSMISPGLSSISATVNHQTIPVSQSSSGRVSLPTQDICIGTSVGTVTEPDCLGPCEPGTAVTLEGIVWHETESGVLVVNVTWRGKTYVGTLIDCTKTDWAPPRFCDSPTSDLEMRTPKNRAKRGRGQTATPVNEVQSDLRVGNVKLRNGAKGRRGSASNTAFVAPASPMKGEQWPKRKTRGSETEGQDEPAPKTAKRLKVSKEDRKDRQSNSPILGSNLDKQGGPCSPALIECPEPNCSKKYKHINGLRYHQSHAHCIAEDSDSNASTASTQLVTPTDAIELSGGEPMVVDSDLDGIDVSTVTGDDTPTTLVKRNIAANGSGPVNLDDKSYNLNDDGELISKDLSETQDSPLSLSKSSSKSGKISKEVSSLDQEADSKSVGDSFTKEVPSLVSRAPILTVPVPFISLQNRPVTHGHSREQDNIVMKPTAIPGTGSSSIIPPKGIPWQPHAHTHLSNSGPTYPQQSGITTLNIPLTGDKSSSKDKFSSESHGKKNKHKKKSKDKDKDGKSKSSGSKGDGGKSKDGTRNSSRIFQSLSPSESLHGRESGSADDLRSSKRDEFNFPDTNSGNAADGRDDPQSPAYSDISDANDSGDAELNVTIGKEPCKNLSAPSDALKKDVPGIPSGHPISPYYSSFYSPYLDSNHPSKLGDKPISPEETEKLKAAKSMPHAHIQNLPPGNGPPSSQSNPDDTRRSPKMDFHHPKYLPQQHFFHYPYSNYHFEQGQYGNVMPDSAFNARGFPHDEREKEKEIVGDLSKSKMGERDLPLGMTIKQEPGERMKDVRPTHLSKGNPDDKIGGSKSDFGPDYPEPKSAPYFMQTCSKHSKDPKRDDASKGLQSDKSKESPVESEKELKEREKIEGAKPTMETQGPPPPPTAGSYAYLPQPYLQGNPFGLHFDPGHPLYRQVLVPGPYGGTPYMHPGSMPRYPPPAGGTPLPEDLSRPNAPPGGTASKALDLLQHHAAQYYQVHKIHELSERALKSPSPQVGPRDREPPTGPAPTIPPTSPAGLTTPIPGQNIRNNTTNNGNGSTGNISKPADLTKESKIGPGGPINESSRSPPTQHHVHSHTHHHTHVGIGYPIIPAFPAPHSPAHYGVLPTTPAAAPVIPPFQSQKPT